MVIFLRIFVPVSVPVFALVIVPLALAPSVTYMAIALHLTFYCRLCTSLWGTYSAYNMSASS